MREKVVPNGLEHLRRNPDRALLIVLAALLLVAASCQRPEAKINPGSETVGRQGNVEFVDGVAARQVRLTIPPGVLTAATGGEVKVATSTMTEAPISAVEFEVGPPAEGSTVVDEIGQAAAVFPWTLPDGCEQGCEVVFPVTIRHIGPGVPPRILWTLEISVLYGDINDVPDLLPADWPAVIEEADGGG